MITLTIDGVNLESALGSGSLSITDITGRGPSRRDATLLEVPERDGAFLRRIKTPAREISVSFVLRGANVEDLRLKVDQLNDIVTTKRIVPLQFSDEDKTYYGILADTTDWDEVRSLGMGTFNFICPDPFKYDGEESAYFNPETESVVAVSEGNEETPPRFEAVALKSVTHVDFVREDGEYMRIGRPAEIGDTVFEKETLVFHDPCNTTTGWTTATYADHGSVTGDMTSVNGAFVASRFGEVVDYNSWQGPSIKRSIGEALEGFQIDVMLENFNTGGDKVGMIEIYLLDADNNTVAKIGMEDVNYTATLMQGKFQLGPVSEDRFEYYRRPDNPTIWNDFNGMIRLRREKVKGSSQYRYRPYFALVDKYGVHSWFSRSYSYYDFYGEYSAPITQVQVAIRKWPEEEETQMRVKDIKIWRINEQPEGIPTILKAGDQLVIDHANDDILINGESRKDLKDFGATFFTIEPGYNTIFQSPKGALETVVYWRNKYK